MDGGRDKIVGLADILSHTESVILKNDMRDDKSRGELLGGEAGERQKGGLYNAFCTI